MISVTLAKWIAVYLLAGGFNWVVITALLTDLNESEEEMKNYYAGRKLFTFLGFFGTAGLAFFFFKGLIKGLLEITKNKS